MKTLKNILLVAFLTTAFVSTADANNGGVCIGILGGCKPAPPPPPQQAPPPPAPYPSYPPPPPSHYPQWRTQPAQVGQINQYVSAQETRDFDLLALSGLSSSYYDGTRIESVTVNLAKDNDVEMWLIASDEYGRELPVLDYQRATNSQVNFFVKPHEQRFTNQSLRSLKLRVRHNGKYFDNVYLSGFSVNYSRYY